MRNLYESRRDRMCLSVLLLALILFPAITMAGSLDQYRWQNRLLIIAMDRQDDESRMLVKEKIQSAECSFSNRDMRVGWLEGDGAGRIDQHAITEAETQRIINRLAVPESKKPYVILIGKDGGVKARYAEFPALKEVYALIDGMPMRRAEMHADNDDCI